MKARNNTNVGLREEVNKLAAEKQTMDEELVQLQPLRQHVSELDWLRKELEEKGHQVGGVVDECHLHQYFISFLYLFLPL